MKAFFGILAMIPFLLVGCVDGITAKRDADAAKAAQAKAEADKAKAEAELAKTNLELAKLKKSPKDTPSKPDKQPIAARDLVKPQNEDAKGNKPAPAEPEKPILSIKEVGELSANYLEVGQRGTTFFLDAKVRQVLDKDQMLVGIESSRSGNSTYSMLVLVKCPTAGIVDGKFWSGASWKTVTGSTTQTVTGTTTIKTVGGGSKTVFVLEPYIK
jgi:hypothetical protein